MNQSDFIAQLEELMELPAGTLDPASVLAETDKWDSLTVVATIAMIDERLGLVLPAQKLTNAATVGEVLSLVGMS